MKTFADLALAAHPLSLALQAVWSWQTAPTPGGPLEGISHHECCMSFDSWLHVLSANDLLGHCKLITATWMGVPKLWCVSLFEQMMSAWLKGAPLMDTSHIAGCHPQLHKCDARRSPKPPKAAVVSSRVVPASGQVAMTRSDHLWNHIHLHGNTGYLVS